MALTRMVSLGSCAAAVLFPVLTLFINDHYTVLTEGKAGSTYLESNPYLAIYPGLAIILLVLAFNYVGDGLRDALDPKLK